MGRLFRQGMIVAVVLSIAAGGLALRLHSQTPFSAVDPEVDARREQLEQRVADARQAGRIGGLAYLALLNQQHTLLVHQRRAEANGMTVKDKRELMAEMDRASAKIDRYIKK